MVWQCAYFLQCLIFVVFLAFLQISLFARQKKNTQDFWQEANGIIHRTPPAHTLAGRMILTSGKTRVFKIAFKFVSLCAKTCTGDIRMWYLWLLLLFFFSNVDPQVTSKYYLHKLQSICINLFCDRTLPAMVCILCDFFVLNRKTLLKTMVNTLLPC